MVDNLMTVMGVSILVVTVFLHGVRLRDLEEQVESLKEELDENQRDFLAELNDLEERRAS